MTQEIIKPRTETEFPYEALNDDGEWIGVESFKHATEKLGRKPGRREYRPVRPDTIIRYSADGSTVYAHWSNDAVTVWTQESSAEHAADVAANRNALI